MRRHSATGPGRGCRLRPNGKRQRVAPMAASTHGAMLNRTLEGATSMIMSSACLSTLAHIPATSRLTAVRTWQGTYGNGATTGMLRTTTLVVRAMTRKVPIPAPLALTVAAVVTTAPVACSVGVATTGFPPIMTTALGSGAPTSFAVWIPEDLPLLSLAGNRGN